MAQAATRQRSAVRERHAAHPSHPEPASKPGIPASAAPGGKRGRGHRNTGRGGRDAARNSGARSGGGGDGVVSRLGRGAGSKLADRKPQLSELASAALERASSTLPKPHLPTSHLPKPHLSIWTRLVGKVLKAIAKHEWRRLTKGTNWSLESLGGEEPGELLGKLGGGPLAAGLPRPKLPIQQSIDVAVPLEFAWRRWMELRFLPEGVDRVTGIERSDGELSGELDGESEAAWSAEVLDERECESFAWQSHEGSDCAGLVTFHRLSERLTRLELTLDVLPHDASEAALLLTRVAHRRARDELRRFKAELELVSPDVYTSDERSSSR